jgi:hypothetical protein
MGLFSWGVRRLVSPVTPRDPLILGMEKPI